MITFLSLLPFDFPYGVIFLLTSIVITFYLWSQYKQKMELIKKGESLVQFDSLEQIKLTNLARGIIAIMLSLGIFTGHLLEKFTVLEPLVSYVCMILLFFGFGALIFYKIIKNK